MAQISLIDEKLDSQNNGRNTILFDVYFGKLFNFKILNLFYYSGLYKNKRPMDHIAHLRKTVQINKNI